MFRPDTQWRHACAWLPLIVLLATPPRCVEAQSSSSRVTSNRTAAAAVPSRAQLEDVSPGGPDTGVPDIPSEEELDLGTISRRLLEAEAEIQRLKEHPEDSLGQDDRDSGLDTDAGATPGGPPDWKEPFQALEKTVKDLKAGPAKPKYPTVEIHGVFQLDSGWFAQEDDNHRAVGDLQDGVSFRRARLSANGAVTSNMNYFLQMDFAFPGRPTFTDLWWEMTQVPLLGNVRVGQWKQPFSLEVVSSFRYTTFEERSLGFQAFTPFRHVAVGFYDWSEDEHMTWAASVYRPGNDQYGGSITDEGGYAGVGRVTWLPWYEEQDKTASYLHLGAAYNYVAPNFRLARFRSIPEYFVGEQSGAIPPGTSLATIPGPLNGVPFFVDTGLREINHYNLVGTELLWVNGPLSFQSEWMYLVATRKDGQGAEFPSYYGQLGYFLTGEHRPYLKKAGAIDRVKPFRNVRFFCSETGEEPGWGAWEVAVRYSYLNLNSKDIEGGRLNDVTVGLNWYLNPNAKVQFNWIQAFLDNPRHGDSRTDIFGLRTQVDF